ncbi:MAG: hypothetical protein ACOYM3_19215 [Terrimicrobiaceae bacterium]
MINTTTLCRCGGEKKERVQFCEPCWNGLPETERGLYLRGLGNLHAVIGTCGLALDIAIQKGEQPCL